MKTLIVQAAVVAAIILPTTVGAAGGLAAGNDLTTTSTATERLSHVASIETDSSLTTLGNPCRWLSICGWVTVIPASHKAVGVTHQWPDPNHWELPADRIKADQWVAPGKSAGGSRSDDVDGFVTNAKCDTYRGQSYDPTVKLKKATWYKITDDEHVTIKVKC